MKTFSSRVRTRTLVDITVGGSLMKKNIEDAYELLEEMAANIL